MYLHLPEFPKLGSFVILYLLSLLKARLWLINLFSGEPMFYIIQDACTHMEKWLPGHQPTKNDFIYPNPLWQERRQDRNT